MLSRGSSAATFQKIVARTVDLPSTLDAQPGDKVIVKETEDVYGFSGSTRTWEIIGTLKKVGGKKPEEIAAHIDGKENPHGTTLQQALSSGAEASVPDGLTLRGGPKQVVRLLGGGSVLRIGDDEGELDGIIWANAGPRSQTRTLVRFVGNGSDRFVVSGDGSITSSGSAKFAGGFKGPALFEDEVTASEGLFGAKGYDLVLGSDKSIVLRLGDVQRAAITDKGLSVSGSLGVTGDLQLAGLVLSSLNPQGKLSLGAPVARWESAALKALDLAPDADQVGVLIRVAPNAKKHALLVSSSAPGDVVALLPTGQLGIGTDAPERRLDVRGSGIVVGDGKARLSLDTALAFNRGPDGKPVDPALASWALSIGVNDLFSVSRKSTSGQTRTVIVADEDLIRLGGETLVEGNLVVNGALQISGISAPDVHHGVFFGKVGTTYTSGKHSFVGPVSVDGPLTVGAVSVKDGNLLGQGGLGSESAPWSSAHLSELLQVGGTTLVDGVISHDKGLTLSTPILSIGSQLRMEGALAEIHVLDVLEVKGAGGSMIIGAGPYLGLTFEGEKPATIYGVGEVALVSAPGATEPAISVEQTWTGRGIFAASTVDVTDEGSDDTSTLVDYRVNGRRVAAVRKDRLEVAGSLHVGGLAFKKLQEDVQLDGQRAETKFKIPAGVRVEAVVMTVLSAVSGARFVQLGDAAEPDRFAGPSTDLGHAAVLRGLNHCDRGLSVQRVAGPVVLTADAPATGKVRITVYYVDPLSA